MSFYCVLMIDPDRQTVEPLAVGLQEDTLSFGRLFDSEGIYKIATLTKGEPAKTSDRSGRGERLYDSIW